MYFAGRVLYHFDNLRLSWFIILKGVWNFCEGGVHGGKSCWESRLHITCLQVDVKAAAKRKVKGSVFTLLRRRELLKEIIAWIDFSAWIDEKEFHYLWTHVLQRMEGAEKGDFNEPDFAKYLRESIFIWTILICFGC